MKSDQRQQPGKFMVPKRSQSQQNSKNTNNENIQLYSATVFNPKQKIKPEVMLFKKDDTLSLYNSDSIIRLLDSEKEINNEHEVQLISQKSFFNPKSTQNTENGLDSISECSNENRCSSHSIPNTSQVKIKEDNSHRIKTIKGSQQKFLQDKQYNNLLNENLRLQETINKLCDQIQSLEKLQRLKNGSQSHKEEIDYFTNKLQVMIDQVTQLESGIFKKNDEINQLKIQLEKSDKTCISLKYELLELQEKQQPKSKYLKEMQEQIEQLNQVNQQQKFELEKYQNKFQHIQSNDEIQFKDFQQKIENMLQEQEKNQNKIKEQQLENAKLATKLADSLDQFSIVSEENANLRQQIQQNTNSLQNQLQEAKEAYEQIQREKKIEKQNYEKDLQLLIKKLDESKQKLLSQFQKQQELSLQEKSKLLKTIDEKSSQNEYLQNRVLSLQQQLKQQAYEIQKKRQRTNENSTHTPKMKLTEPTQISVLQETQDSQKILSNIENSTKHKSKGKNNSVYTGPHDQKVSSMLFSSRSMDKALTVEESNLNNKLEIKPRRLGETFNQINENELNEQILKRCRKIVGLD